MNLRFERFFRIKFETCSKKCHQAFLFAKKLKLRKNRKRQKKSFLPCFIINRITVVPSFRGLGRKLIARLFSLEASQNSLILFSPLCKFCTMRETTSVCLPSQSIWTVVLCARVFLIIYVITSKTLVYYLVRYKIFASMKCELNFVMKVLSRWATNDMYCFIDAKKFFTAFYSGWKILHLLKKLQSLLIMELHLFCRIPNYDFETIIGVLPYWPKVIIKWVALLVKLKNHILKAVMMVKFCAKNVLKLF